MFGIKYGLSNYVVVIEGSWHKFTRGVNSHEGICEPKYIFKCLIKLTERMFNIQLPVYNKWYLLRIDIAKCFDLQNQENVKNYINSLSHCSYPKRKAKFFADETFYLSGTTTTLKIYNKQAEFIKHDYKKFTKSNYLQLWYLKKNKIRKWRMKMRLDVFSYIQEIQGFVRFECEIHKKKLQKIYKCDKIPIKYVKYEDLEKVWNDEFMKLLKFINKDMKLVSDRNDVYKRLEQSYNLDLANKLYNFYNIIKIDGIEQVRKRYPKATYYKYLKCLKNCAIDFSQNYVFDESKIYNFNPFEIKEVS